jgi:hypothetical protein
MKWQVIENIQNDKWQRHGNGLIEKSGVFVFYKKGTTIAIK